MNKRIALGEVGMVVLTGALHLIFENVLGWKVPFIAAATIGWGTYIVVRARRDSSLLSHWGVAQMKTGQGWFVAGLFWLFATASLVVFASLRGTFAVGSHFLIVGGIYPIFGIVQQFVLNAMLVRNLSLLISNKIVVVSIGALLFGIVHAPDLPLMACTFVAGLVWASMFLRCRNLLPLGVCHGLLGTMVYFWVLERDPWGEILSSLLGR